MVEHPCHLITSGRSHRGKVRKNNEDRWAALQNYRFFIVADGIGGHRAGEVAATEAVRSVCHFIKSFFSTPTGIRREMSPAALTQLFKKTIAQANEWVYALSCGQPAYQGMGTTLCTLLFPHEKQLLVYAHVGDSRIYRFREGRLTQLTADHVLRPSPSSPLCPAERTHVLTRAIGTSQYVKAEVATDQILPNDLYFMCTDGLTDCVSHQDITSILRTSSTPDIATQRLIDRANAGGGRDNITVVMVQVQPTLADPFSLQWTDGTQTASLL